MSANSVNRIEELLLNENSQNHEASTCIECGPDELPSGGVKVDLDKIGELEEIGQPVYMDEDEAILYPMSHDLIIGSTGAGKTYVLYNNLINFYMQMPKKKRPSFLVFDLKGDMHAKHSKRLRELGYKVEIFNARDAFYSSCYNPLGAIFDAYVEGVELSRESIFEEDTGEFSVGGKRFSTRAKAFNYQRAASYALKDKADRYISEIAEIFVPSSDPKNLSWVEGARNCLKAIIYTLLNEWECGRDVTREMFTIDNVCRIAFSTGNDYATLISWLKRAKHVSVVSSALGSCYDINARVTRDGYVSTLNTELGKYASASISALTARNDINFKSLAEGEEDHAIFIVTDDRRQITTNLSMMLMNDLVNALCEKADSSPKHALDKDFIIFADEMGNLPKLPGMSAKISTLRSRKIWLHMAIQSIEQLEEIYGHNVTATILDNCDVHMFLGCNNAQTKEHFCASMGNKIGVRKSANIGSDGLATISVSTENVPVVHKSDLEELSLGHFYLRARKCQNIKSYMIPYFLRKDVNMKDDFEEKEYNGYDGNQNIYDIYEVVE